MSTFFSENVVHLTCTLDFQIYGSLIRVNIFHTVFYTYLQVSRFDILSDDSDRVLLSNLYYSQYFFSISCSSGLTVANILEKNFWKLNVTQS